MTREMALIRKSHSSSHVRERAFARTGGKQRSGVMHAQLDHMLMGRHTKRLLEEAGQVERAHISSGGDVPQTDVANIVPANELQRVSHRTRCYRHARGGLLSILVSSE